MDNKLGTIAICAVALCGTVFAVQPNVARAQSTQTVITQTNGDQENNGAPIRVVVDGSKVDFDGPGPIMMNGGYVFVPIRGVFEQMGGDVDWHEESQTVEGAKPGHVFRIRVGSTNALVNGEATTLASPPQLIGGTTYVPLRFASEALGAHVRWDQDRNTVFIRTHGDDTDDFTDPGRSMHVGLHDNNTDNDDNGDTSTTTTIIKKTTTP